MQQPENGTTTYGYDNQGRTAWKQDAKGQKVVYTYDSSDRVTMEQRYLTSNGLEVTSQRTTYYYDQDPDGDTGGSWAGRLAKIVHGSGLVERFRYTVAGLTASKSQSLGQTTPLVTAATVDYAYNDEGRPTAIAYPEAGFIGTNGAYYPRPRLTLSYSYNASGMLYGVNRADTGLALVTNAQYGTGGRLSSVSRPQSLTLDANSLLPTAANDVTDEAYSYNALGQMTSQSWAGVSKQYSFTAGANDGRVSQIVNSPGETVNYTFDSLGRLSTAATASPAWGLNWAYDGFGNRLQQNVTKGAAISVQMSIDPATNRLLRSDIAYDANGNLTNWTSAQGAVALTYDIDNRVTQVTAPNGVETYDYTAGNQRVVINYPNNGSLQSQMEAYGAGGELLSEYSICAITGGQYQGSYALCNPYQRIYFAGRLMLRQTSTPQMTAINTDRLGSAIQTFPYGDTLSPVDPDKESFATYSRDGVEGLDYAQNRYYSSTWGRYVTVDPLMRSATFDTPLSWNRYSYVTDDPINRIDPTGLEGSFCGHYRDFPVCKIFTYPVYPGFGPVQPTGIEPSPGFLGTLNGYPGAALAFTQLTDSCAKAIGAPDGRSAGSMLYFLLANAELSDLGFSSKVFELPTALAPAELTWQFAQAMLRNGTLYWNNNAAVQDLTNVTIGVGNFSGATYQVNVLEWFFDKYQLDTKGMALAAYQGILMLHELAHWYNGILDDAGDWDQTMKNTQSVIDKCFKSFKK